MKPENQWSERAKAPDPDDLTSERPSHGDAPAGIFERRGPHVDYTAIEHHEEVPDPRDTGDPSRPQGEFWHQNERAGAEAPHAGEPIPVTPEAQQGTDELPAVFFSDRKKHAG